MLPLPDRGTPIDTQVLYEIIEEINSLRSAVTSATYKTTTITSESGNTRDVRTGDARIYGTFYSVNQEVTQGMSVVIPNIPLTNTFAYTPLVVATPVLTNTSGTTQGAPVVNVSITSVTRTAVSLRLYFLTSGKAEMRINILAIGIPEGVA